VGFHLTDQPLIKFSAFVRYWRTLTINLTSDQHSYNFSRIHDYTPIWILLLLLLFIFIFYILCYLSYNTHVIFLVTYCD
jgi:hypothetical protein